ncbi:MAG: hypothetical protein D4R80_06550 [Deltaproteobacteria bacterium]|nr:MAG: hypothetical protein D4R80_06550 [Deltaproteobacteria bacterium]
MKSMKIVITKPTGGVFVQLEKGSVEAKFGEVVEAPENEAKILVGMKRARLYDPAIDAPPVVEEEVVVYSGEETIAEPDVKPQGKPSRKKKGE